MRLEDGSRVAVVGGGPAGSFFSLFLLKCAANVGIELEVDLYEPRKYTAIGPGSCNHCGGIVSESLVQLLATEGINLPSHVVRRGIDAYVLHTDLGSVQLETPFHEKRIAAVYRGAGPRGSTGLEPGRAGPDVVVLAPELEVVRPPAHQVEHGVDAVAGVGRHDVDAFSVRDEFASGGVLRLEVDCDGYAITPCGLAEPLDELIEVLHGLDGP